MQRYFFELCDDGKITSDDDGQQMSSLEAAEHEAVAVLPELARIPTAGEDHCVITSTLRDQSGRMKLRATLTLTVERWG